MILFFNFQLAVAAEFRQIKVGSDEHFPVIFQNKDGVAQGLYVDLLTEIGRKENIRFEYVFGTWDNTLNRIRSGEIDLLPGVAYSDERAQFMDYCKIPVLTVWGELYSLQSSEINSILDVSGKKIGVIKKDINAKNFLELTRQFHINCELVELPGYEDVFRAIKTRMVDAGVVGISYGASKKGEYGLRSTGVVFNPYDLYIATTKGKNRDLILILDNYLNEWKSRDISIFSNARQKWIYGSVGTVAVVPQWMITLFILLGMAIAVSLTFILLLNRQVKKATRALRESEAKQARMIENIGDVIVIIDQDGINRYKSPNIEKWFGWHPEDVVGISTWDNIHPDDLAAGQQFIETLMKEPYVTGTTECRYRCRDGSYKWIEFTGVNLLHDPVIRGILGNYQDITERKQTEAALKDSEDRLQKAQQVAKIGNWEYDIATKTVWGSEEAFRIYGIERKTEYLPLDDVESTIVDVERVNQALVDLITQNAIYDIEFEISPKNRDGFTFIHSIAERVCDATGNPVKVVGVIQDITNAKTRENEHIKLLDQLQQAQKLESVGRLAGGVAHDFNNMLGVILGHTEMALDAADPSQPLYSDLLEIHNAAERSANLTRQLLAFARKQTIAPKVLNLNETIENMLRMLRRLIGEDIDLAWRPGKQLWPIKIDPSQIDQILANLCVNARDAITDGGKVTIGTENVVLDQSFCTNIPECIPGDYVRVAISDDGCGMDTETLPRIFEPFFTSKEMGKGTGLGLATVYGIVRQNNGFIHVYSEPDQGTTFRIYLPHHVETDAPPLEKDLEKPAGGGKETVLVAEDEPAILNMTRMMLERLGYRVLTASSPDEAVRMAHEHADDIHLLMTDVVMPGMNGQDLAMNIRSVLPRVKSLFMSGYTADIIAHQGVLEPDVDFIQKPFSMKDLATGIRKALDGK